ncbi:MAG: ADOP family duplicated permease [Gemmatimonadaceae bacterium]
MPEQPRWRRYLRFWRSNVSSDVNDELAFHVQERIDDLVARGMHPLAARDEAMKRLGDLEQLRMTCRSLAQEQETTMKRSELIHAAKQDSTYALRLMRAHPAFTAAIVLTLALGIGATTSIFSVVNAVLLRPLPWNDSERLVIIYETVGAGRGRLSAGHFHDYVEQSRSFAATAAWQSRTFNLTDGEPERVIGARTTPGFFQVQHMRPELGRYFLPTETADSRVAVLSYPLWRTRFNADPAIVGKSIMLNGESHTVVGVTPEAYTLTQFDERLWTPLTFTPEQRTNYGAHSWAMFAKLRPDVTQAQALKDLQAITEDIRRRAPDQMAERGVTMETYNENLTSSYRTQLWVLLGAVASVLLIGCGNVASLLLARAMTRRKEVAIRGALGGSRRRLMGQLLIESLMMAMLGGGLGLAVAYLGIRFLKGMGPAEVPRLGEAGLHPEVLLFALGVTLLCGILFGLAPALRATRIDLQGELRDGGRGSRAVIRDRMRAALIVSEVAVALVLLVSAGLFIRSAHRLQQVPLGFDPGGVTMMRVSLPATRYDSAVAVQGAFTRIVDQVRAIPGVQSAAAGTRVPMWGPSIDIGVTIDGQPNDPTRRPPVGHVRLVSDDFIETIGVRLQRGRLLNDADLVSGAPWVVVVNETFAKSVFGQDDPIGKRISGWTAVRGVPEWREIVGVVSDVRSFGRDNDTPPEIYMPFSQAPSNAWNSYQRAMTIVAKARPGATIAPAMREAVKRVDPELPLYDLQTMDDVLSRATAQRRFNTMLLSLLGATGLILAAIGIYGVIAFFVNQRTHEIGVRVALGASTREVVGLVIRQAAVLAVAGIVVGAVAANWATSVLQRMLFQVEAKDPVAFISGAVVLLLVALGAALIPARRAARVAPVQALSGG